MQRLAQGRVHDMERETHMAQYIEVIGQASVSEVAVEQRVALTVSHRGKGGGMSDKVVAHKATQQRERVIATLLAHGMREHELHEGGMDSGTWHFKRKREVHHSHRILLICEDDARLFAALEALAPLQDEGELDLQLDMLDARYEVPAGALSGAQQAAVAHAREHANGLAQAAGVALGAVVQVQELAPARERSGAYGESWYGLAAAGGAAAAPAMTLLASNQRTRTLSYRVRFALQRAVP
ncbi:hypothetical protein CCO03_04740 [Comamonas serinivorans]|uniref:SIMPL domain-containing protein n=2 Tax=Comamonas serinivorans TaxID=1082851 RepID=A0A1Y0EL84_9BURK|nr:hypothetical protein CCO03_04740 [Comamonas serinivorans]